VIRKDRDSRNSEGDKRIDIHDVAAEAAVSIATASRVLNRVSTVDPVLKKRVLAAMEKLGYVPNRQARSLVSGRSNLFGVIISDITNPFFPELIRGFESRSVEIGYEVLIGSTDYDPAQMELCVQRMLERNVDGVAGMTFGIEAPLLDRLAAKHIPMVFIDVAPRHELATAIKIDYEHGINEAVQHLAVLGHRKIGFISGPRTLHSAVARERAFRRSIGQLGLKVQESYIIEGDHTIERGQQAFEALNRLQNPPSAIMCSNDMTAIGVMHGAFDAGLRVPRDLSIIGFDDIHLARHILPPLTTVRMSCRELGAAAVDALRSHIAGKEKVVFKNDPLRTSLIVRQTTAIPKGSLADLRKSPRNRR